MKKLILGLLLISSVANATAEEDARDYKLLSDKLKEKVELQSKEISILDQRLQNYMTLADSTSKDLGNKETTEGLYRFAYFALGCIVTGFVAVNVRR